MRMIKGIRKEDDEQTYISVHIIMDTTSKMSY